MADTHAKTVFSLGRKVVNIIEFGPAFFNKDSVVLMPARLAKHAGAQPVDDPVHLGKREGFVLLAAVFKQFEFDNRLRMVLAGHTNEDGASTLDKAEISTIRAQTIIYLLFGGQANKKNWAAAATARHRIEDYQRILKYFHLIRHWDCDPGPIDDKWDAAKTYTATSNFCEQCRKHFHLKITAKSLADKVKDDANKKWPQTIWEIVFDLYRENLATVLKVKDPKKIPSYKLKFIDNTKPLVACGESFPLDADAAERTAAKYVDKQYRRVEVLFFQAKQAPGVVKGQPKFICPVVYDRKHEAKECPIWYKKHLACNYIDPFKDLKSVAYHLTFKYYDRVLRRIAKVPEGLEIEAHHYQTPGTLASKKLLDSVTTFFDGVYTVKVVFDPAPTNIHFEAKTLVTGPPPQSKWIYTKDKNATPQIVIKNNSDIADLVKPDKVAERFTYYDLPGEWSSENYWTRYRVGKSYLAERFEEVLKNKKKLKPYAGNVTAADAPLVFSLDDIALVKADGKQDIEDMKKDGVTNVALSANSRISILYVKNSDLVLYNQWDAKAPYFSKNAFKANLISDYPADVRLIVFANGFYHVFDKRAGQNPGTFDPNTKTQIKGCRAAMLEDKEWHLGMVFDGNAAPAHNRYAAKGTGNFELHYVHNGCAFAGPGGLKARSFLVVHWNGRFQAKHKGTSSDNHVVAAADLAAYAKDGLKNSKLRWEHKGYTIEPFKAAADGRGNLQIKPVFFFEAKEADNGGKHKCTVDITNDTDAGSMGVDSAEMYYPDYKIRDYLGVGSFTDVDGKAYETLVVSHEIGHAMGKDDEYAYHNGEHNDATDKRFAQYYPGMPYHFDEGSMMQSNRAPRMKQLWLFTNRLNDASADNNELKKLLGGTDYQLVHRFVKGAKRKKLQYHLASAPNDYRDIYNPFKLQRGAPTSFAGSPPAVPAVAGTGKVNFALYKLGEDEYARNIPIGGSPTAFAFTGILVVFVKIYFEFKDHVVHTDPDPAKWIDNLWSDATAPDRYVWMDGVKAELNDLNKRFYLQSTQANQDFKHTYLFFFPLALEKDWLTSQHSAADATAAKGAANYKLEVVYTKAAGVTRTAADNLKVGNTVSKRWLARYVLGHDPGGVTAPNSAAIAKNDFLFIRKWLRDKLGDNTFDLKGT